MKHIITKSEISKLPEIKNHHEFNPKIIRFQKNLSQHLGLENLSIELIRLKPNSEGTEYHSHSHEEEFLYILNGKGKVIIDDDEYNFSSGDIVAFPCDKKHHTWYNTSKTEDLTYLFIAELKNLDMVEMPRIKKTHFKVGNNFRIVND